jgi:hypothetical protein
MRTSIASAGLVALFIVLGVPATGVAADIVGCVNGTTGILRIVSSSSSCRTNESAIELASPPTTSPPSTFTTTVPQDSTDVTLATLDNGVIVHGTCFPGFVEVKLTPSSNAFNLQAFGITSGSNAISPVDVHATSSTLTQSGTTPYVDFDVVARDVTVGQFARISVHGAHADPCIFWGMIIPTE